MLPPRVHLLISVRLPWDADHFKDILCRKPGSDGFEEPPTEGLESRFGFLDEEHSVKTPHTVVDCHGRILVWILPDVFNARRQVCMPPASWVRNTDTISQAAVYNATRHLPILAPSDDKGWRSASDLFRAAGPNDLMSGTLNFSPAWYASGHEVNTPPLSDVIYRSADFGIRAAMQPSWYRLPCLTQNSHTWRDGLPT